MSPSETPLPQQRLHRALIAMLLILGTAVALLLAHSNEANHPSDEPSPISVEVVHQTDSKAELLLASPADHDTVPFGDSLALCLSIGLGCVTALLLVLLRLRRPPAAKVIASSSSATPHQLVRVFDWVPRPSLATLCIIRI